MRSKTFMGIVAVLLAASVRPAMARPEYARREGRPCQYCHMSGSPGYVDPQTGSAQPTTRNKRGEYYAAHNHSFTGYNELGVMGRQSPPLFHFLWRQDMAGAPRRAAVGDVTADGKPRMVTLSEKPGGGAVLQVLRWNGAAFATEFQADDASAPDALAVGHFAGQQKPELIVTGDSIWHWNGTTFVAKHLARAIPVLGTARMRQPQGEERLLLALTPTDVRAYRVDFDAPGDPLIDGIPSPGSAAVTSADMHGSADFFDKVGLLPLVYGAGVVGLWDVRKFGTLFFYYSHIFKDFDTRSDTGDPKKTEFVLKGTSSFVTFRDPRTANGPELWTTPQLPGQVYDVALEDPRTGEPALLVLMSDSATGKGRGLYCFGLD